MKHENDIIISWLSDIAVELNHRAKLSGRDLIFYPFHVFSDELPVIVLSMMMEKKLYVISDVSEDDWLRKWGEGSTSFRNLWLQNLNLCNPFELQAIEATRMIKRIVGERRRGQCEFALFPDALPEYTVRLRGGQNYTKACIFNRPSLLHSGGFSFPKIMQKDVLPFYIYVRRGKIKLEVLPVVEKENINDELPILIETVIQEMHDQWMLWHFPSFFYFNG
ncbi:hypothetical protein ACET60_05620 [Aeromonas veronii]